MGDYIPHFILWIFIIVKDLIRKILKENEPSVHGEWVLPLAVYDFKKEVTKKEWQIISENLQVLYPGIVWKSRKPISNFPSKKMIQIAIYPGTWGDYLECIYTTKHIGLFEPHDKEQAKLIFDGSVLMNKHNTEEIFTKLNESVASKYKLWSVKPGSFIYIREVNPQLEECDYNVYQTIKKLKGTICEVTGTAEDVNLMEMGEVEGETWCDDYWGWGMLIKSDKITMGHDGFGEDNGRCGKSDCYWVNHYFVDFDLIDPSFDTEEAFTQLYEQELGDDFGWVKNLLNKTKDAIPLNPEQKYVVKLCDGNGHLLKGDDIKWKFEELYGVNSLDKEMGTINIFNNNHIDDEINNGNGIIIYVNPNGWDGLEMGWDICSQVNFKYITERGNQIYDYDQFIRLIISK